MEEGKWSWEFPTFEKSETSYFELASNFIASYGWFILAGFVVVLLLRPRVERYLDQLYIKREERKYEERCKKDEDWLNSRNSGLQEAREKMQRELELKSVAWLEKKKEEEEQKRLKALEEYNKKYGSPLSAASSTSAASTSHKPSFNPLMGDSSRGYRPQRKSPCGGGGCGRS